MHKSYLTAKKKRVEQKIPRYLPTSLRVDDGFGSQSTSPAIGLRSADDWKLTFIVDGMD